MYEILKHKKMVEQNKQIFKIFYLMTRSMIKKNIFNISNLRSNSVS